MGSFPSYVFLASLVLIGSFGIAHADIGIDISTKCKVMLKNNIDSNCPSLEQIMAVFPDTSPKHQVGGFEIIDGILQRGQPPYKIDNMASYFRSIGMDDRIWIDPPAEIRNNIKMITIESNFVDYPVAGSFIKENNTIVRGTERYVDSGCKDAMINAGNWLFLLGDTINYIRSGCTITHFDHIKKIYQEPSFQDITTSYKYKLDEWLKKAKIECLTICREY